MESMPGTPPTITKRRLIQAVGAFALLSLAACQTQAEIGKGAGASSSAVDHLAAIRSGNGLPPLRPDPKLEKAALRQAGYMARAGRMTHNTGIGKGFAARMKAGGIEGAAAENVAHGRIGLDRLFAMWMASSGHRRNMLDPRFAHFGLASVEEKPGGQLYWALVLGR